MNNQCIAVHAGFALLLVCLAGGAAASRVEPAQEAVDRVYTRIEAGDCTEAVSRLNAGLAERFPEVQLLAGSMYDNGICVKRNWERAVHFYALAGEGGQKEAANRLAAGFAAPENGPDIAAALWWANRAQNNVRPSACEVSTLSGIDPDRFVAELRTWPQARLQACNYVTGVMMTLVGEIRYPRKAATLAIDGVVHVTFHPSVPRIDVKTLSTAEANLRGVVTGDALRDRKSASVTGSFEQVVHEIAERALKRYPQPPGIDPASQVEVQLQFGMIIQ